LPTVRDLKTLYAHRRKIITHTLQSLNEQLPPFGRKKTVEKQHLDQRRVNVGRCRRGLQPTSTSKPLGLTRHATSWSCREKLDQLGPLACLPKPAKLGLESTCKSQCKSTTRGCGLLWSTILMGTAPHSHFAPTEKQPWHDPEGRHGHDTVIAINACRSVGSMKRLRTFCSFSYNLVTKLSNKKWDTRDQKEGQKVRCRRLR